jgi:hypothetical protein
MTVLVLGSLFGARCTLCASFVGARSAAWVGLTAGATATGVVTVASSGVGATAGTGFGVTVFSAAGGSGNDTICGSAAFLSSLFRAATNSGKTGRLGNATGTSWDPAVVGGDTGATDTTLSLSAPTVGGATGSKDAITYGGVGSDGGALVSDGNIVTPVMRRWIKASRAFIANSDWALPSKPSDERTGCGLHSTAAADTAITAPLIIQNLRIVVLRKKYVRLDLADASGRHCDVAHSSLGGRCQRNLVAADIGNHLVTGALRDHLPERHHHQLVDMG